MQAAIKKKEEEKKMQANKIRKYRPFAFPTQPGTGQYHVAPFDCCKKGERDICFDTMFCPCCLLAKLQSNIVFARTSSRLYEETSSSSDDDENDNNAQNAGVAKSELSRYERRFSSDRSYYDCDTCILAGCSFLPSSFISSICFINTLRYSIPDPFYVPAPRRAARSIKRTKEQQTPLYCCSSCCGEDHPDVGKNCDGFVLIACCFTLMGTTCTPLFGNFYARELRHRQLYDGGCMSAATPQVPSRGWLRRRQVQLVKEHGQTKMKLALDIFRVTWIVSKFVPKLKNRYQFFDENLKIPQMV